MLTAQGVVGEAGDSVPRRVAPRKFRNSIVVVPTCARDADFSALAIEGIRKFWPEATVYEFRDDDRVTETKVPDDIRQMCREVPYLRKQVDAPFLFDGVDDVYIVDCDCFFFARPEEFIASYSYQGQTLYGHSDYPWGLRVWAELGHHFPVAKPLFCAGLFSAPRSMWVYNRELLWDYLRLCARHGYTDPRFEYANVTMDQSFAAGLWRMTCPDNPLPALEYPLGIPSVKQKIFHACYFKKRAVFPLFLKHYAKMLAS